MVQLLKKIFGKINNNYAQSLILGVSFLGVGYSLLRFNMLALIVAYLGIIIFFLLKSFRNVSSHKNFDIVISVAAISVTALFMSFIYNAEVLVNGYTWLFMLFFVGFTIVSYMNITIKKQHIVKTTYTNIVYSFPILATHIILFEFLTKDRLQYVLMLSYLMYTLMLFFHIKKVSKVKRIIKLTSLTHKLDTDLKTKRKVTTILRLFDPIKYSKAKPIFKDEVFSDNYINKNRVGSNRVTIFLVSNTFTQVLKHNPEVLYGFNGRYFKGPFYNPIKLLFDIPFRIFGRYSSLLVVAEPNNIKQPFVVLLGEDKYYISSINQLQHTLKIIDKQNSRFRNFSKRKKYDKAIQG